MKAIYQELVTPGEQDDTIRPSGFDSYLGQARTVTNIRLFVEAALKRGEPLDHVLLYGPPGLGKTSLALIIARETGCRLVTASGPAIERPGDLAAIVVSLEPGSALFIDEIHRLPRVAEELLYSAMEDFRIDILTGSGADARSISIDLPPFTLIGATTRFGALSAPLRDRFGIVERLNYYSDDELAAIVTRSAQIYGFSLEAGAALELGRRSRGTPRIANRLLRRVRDLAQVRECGITPAIVSEALALLDIDAAGLDACDRGYLELLVHRFGGRPAGLSTISSALGEDQATLEDVVEPYLIQQGLIDRTPRGRVATDKAVRLLAC